MELFKDKKLRLGKDGYMYCGNKRVHRIIWEHYYGTIEKGYDIHHKDGNRWNNSLDNLEKILHSKHLSMHMKQNDKKVHAWHKTKKGRKFLGEKSKQLWKNRKVHTLKCAHCSKPFQAKQIDRAKYCDNNCEQAARRKRGDDLEVRTCVMCLKPFYVNKYFHTRTCGYKCGAQLGANNRKKSAC